MYINARLVISSTEQQHTIISDVHKGSGHDSKTAKAMTLYYGKGQYKSFETNFSGTRSKAMSKN